MLDIGFVVGVLHTLAFPEVALLGLVVGLVGGDLLQALDVAVDVSSHVVVGLLAAGCFEDWSGLARLW